MNMDLRLRASSRLLLIKYGNGKERKIVCAYAYMWSTRGEEKPRNKQKKISSSCFREFMICSGTSWQKCLDSEKMNNKKNWVNDRKSFCLLNKRPRKHSHALSLFYSLTQTKRS